jgi:hypothetical protein
LLGKGSKKESSASYVKNGKNTLEQLSYLKIMNLIFGKQKRSQLLG